MGKKFNLIMTWGLPSSSFHPMDLIVSSGENKCSRTVHSVITSLFHVLTSRLNRPFTISPMQVFQTLQQPTASSWTCSSLSMFLLRWAPWTHWQHSGQSDQCTGGCHLPHSGYYTTAIKETAHIYGSSTKTQKVILSSQKNAIKLSTPHLVLVQN